MTPEEKKLWLGVKGNRLEGFHFRRQQVIAGFIADFYCHAAKLVLEVDGGIHKIRTAQDEEKERVFMGKGLKVLRIPNEQIKKAFPEVLEEILRVCKERMV
jgi:very-short-patch-repair endonuclease